MTDFPTCSLCGHTIAITRERDETKPTPAEIRVAMARLRAAGDRNLSQRNALKRITEATTLEDAQAIAVGALTEFA